MSTADQTHSARIHGEALVEARNGPWQPALDRLAALADGRDDLRLQLAGRMAAEWLADPAAVDPHALIAASLLIMAGHLDGDELLRGVRGG